MDCLIWYNRCVYISQSVHSKLYLYANSHGKNFEGKFYTALKKRIFLLIKIPMECSFRYSAHICDVIVTMKIKGLYII